MASQTGLFESSTDRQESSDRITAADLAQELFPGHQTNPGRSEREKLAQRVLDALVRLETRGMRL